MTEQLKEDASSTLEKEEQIKRWNQEEFVKIQKFCHSKGIQLKKIDQNLTKCLAPIVGIWYVNSTIKGEDYWVISGDLPTDLSPSKVASNAREALRYFSMNWQLKAANLEDAIAEGKISADMKETQQKFIKELVTKAEAIYQLQSNDKLWASAGL